ncbi:GM22200 [Drosophila sechellia]|uniref:GM22200 n=1 Tax=Drosophila sechellia TaxID=7238 RepID=B4IAD5_DROSE|nr:GM22200 [Drosophila sechellia]
MNQTGVHWPTTLHYFTKSFHATLIHFTTTITIIITIAATTTISTTKWCSRGSGQILGTFLTSNTIMMTATTTCA